MQIEPDYLIVIIHGLYTSYIRGDAEGHQYWLQQAREVLRDNDPRKEEASDD